MAEDLKKRRTVAKGKLTFSIRRIKIALQRNDDISELNILAQSLENAFDNLHSIHFEYTELTQEDGYIDQISDEYDELNLSYRRVLRTHAETEKIRKASPLHKAVERSFENLDIVVKRLVETLKSGCTNTDIPGLEVDKEQLQNLIESLFKDLAELENFIDTSELYVRQGLRYSYY